MIPCVRRLGRLLLAAAVHLSAQAAEAPNDCPAALQPPTAAQLQAARRDARDRGVLWRISKDGRSSWLYGTIHVGQLSWSLPGPALSRAFQATDVLALELDPLDPDLARQVAAALRAPRPDGTPTPAQRQRLVRQFVAACLGSADGDLLARQPPLMQLVTLNLLAARRDAFELAYGQDLMLAGMARADGRRVVALESVAQQMAALLPDDAALAQAQIEQGLAQLEDGRARKLLRRLATAWAEGDLATLERHAEWCDCANTDAERAQLRRINDARNPHLADGIAALHDQGLRVLAAVGALHMTGPQALPHLLEQRGFQLQRVVF